jgi:hypothetical protein
MGNNVYAFDADAPAGSDQIWKTPLGTPFDPPATTVNGHRSTSADSWGINIDWGILSTPVIDMNAKKMYVVNFMLVNAKPALFLHQLLLTSGKEIGKAKPITGVVNGADGQPLVDANGDNYGWGRIKRCGPGCCWFRSAGRTKHCSSRPLAAKIRAIRTGG